MGGGGAAQGGSQPAALQGGGGGQGDPSRPPVHRRHTAAGKRPVQAGSPGLSTPSKTKRGRGVSGAGMAGRAPAQEQRRPAATRGLFALGFTRTATATAHRDVGQGGAPVPPRERTPRAGGTEGPAARKPEPLVRVLLSRCVRVH